jgi:hypothetical protein
MLLKKLMIALSVIAMVATLGLIQGCSENENPVEPLITDVDQVIEPLITEDEEFREALRNGEFQFSVDEGGNLIPLDGISIPEVEKEIYKKFLKESVIPRDEKGQITGKASSVSTNYWRYAIYREICYALSRTKYLRGQWGQSTQTYYYYGLWLAGDWNYNGQGVGIGGQCKQFASTIVRRATGGRYVLPSGYDYAHGDISWCRPGDVIQRSNRYGTQHTAIVFTVLARDRYGRATRIDVIDANFIGGSKKGLIARHYFPIWNWPLWQFRIW